METEVQSLGDILLAFYSTLGILKAQLTSIMNYTNLSIILK